MSSVVEQLNLTPQERRIVVVIAVVVFIVLNLLLVWPHFHDLARVRVDLEATRNTIQKENAEILKDIGKGGYREKLHTLEKNQGGGIGNQQIQLQRTISDQAIRTGVSVAEIRPVTSIGSQTNEFYEEQSVKITFECVESQLVNFLFNMGNDPAMIRVRELNLKTADANRYRLRGDATLTANYAKQPAAAPAKPKPATAGAKAPPGAPKPFPGDKLSPKPRMPMAPGGPSGVPLPRKNL